VRAARGAHRACARRARPQAADGRADHQALREARDIDVEAQSALMEDDADPGFDTVRTTLQSALKIPFAVTVTSSQPHDGKTRLAAGTARAFAAAGFTTILVDANPANPSVAGTLKL